MPHTSGPDLALLLQASRIDRSSVIRVTGPNGLSALLWLCRHGFEQVGYLKPGFGPNEAPDALIVAHTCDAAAVRRLLVDGPHAREGGVMVFQSPVSANDGDGSVRRLLEGYGYTIERCMQGARRELYIARRRPRASKAA